MNAATAWHFVGDTLRDGRPVPADGVPLIHPGKPVLCESGLHASLDPFDALKYAPGPNLCLVRCSGGIFHADDKMVCTERVIVTRMDATDLLREFARMQALSVAHLWDPPDVVLDYLMTGDDSIRRAARDAARDAAWAAARGAARGAARDAVWDATREAARDATRDATNAATLAATRDDWWDFSDIASLAKSILGPRSANLGIQCARLVDWLWQGGNQWSGYDAFLSFFRYIAKLPIVKISFMEFSYGFS